MTEHGHRLSRISVDLVARSFEIEVPDEALDKVLDRLEKMFSMVIPTALKSAEEQPAKSASETQFVEAEKSSQSAERVTPPSPKRSNASKSNAKVKVPVHVDLGLSPAEMDVIRKDYGHISPAGQSNKIAALAVLYKRLKGIDILDINQAHSLLKIVSEKTPKNLTAVFGNMKRDGIAGYNENKLLVNAYTEDHVDHKLKSDKKKEK